MPTPVVRQYTVFNAEQADGLPARPTPTAEPLWKVHQHTEKVWEDSGVPVRHVAGDRAFYNLNRDEIVLPERGSSPPRTTTTRPRSTSWDTAPAIPSG